MYYDESSDYGTGYDYGTGMDPSAYGYSGGFVTNGSGGGSGNGAAVQITAPSYANTPIAGSFLADPAVIDPTLLTGSDLTNLTPTSNTMDEEQQAFQDFQNYVNGSGGAVDTSVYVDPNTGVQTQDNGDGTFDSYDPNTGTTGFYDQNTGESETINPDGSGQYTDAQGNVTTWTADGTSTTSFVGGGTLIQAPDGSGTYTDQYGTSAFDANGVLISYVDNTSGYTYTLNGNIWTETYADGSSCSGDLTGNYCCDDGTCTPGWANKATNTSYQRTPGPPTGGSGGGGGSRSAGGQQQQQQNPLAQAKLPVMPTIPRPPTSPYGTSPYAASPYATPLMAQQAAAGQGINIGGTTISWTWIAIGAVLLLVFAKK